MIEDTGIFLEGTPKEIAEEMLKPRKSKRACSFCGKNQHEVKHLLAAPEAHICNECVELSVQLIREDMDPEFCHDNLSLKDIKDILQNFTKQIFKEAEHGEE